MGLLLLATGCGGSSGDPVVKAADKTSAEKSVRIRFTVSGPGIAATATGVFENRRGGVGRMSVETSGSRGDVHLDAVGKGSIVYLRSPAFASQLPAGKTWLRVDLRTAPKRLGLGLVGANPREELERLRGSDGHPARVGTAHVAGVETTHYLSKVRTVPVDVWIDGSGLVRRESYTQRVAGTPVRLTSEFVGFGVPVDVSLPPADKVVNAPATVLRGG